MKSKRNQESEKALLPLSPVEFQVLLALAEEAMHGYAIMLRTERRSNGGVKLEPGNLYRALKRLLDRRLITRSQRKQATESGDERRRYYRITDLGREVGAAETRRMAQLVEEAQRTRLAAGPEISR